MQFLEVHPVILVGMTIGLAALSLALLALLANRHNSYLATREAERNFRDLYEHISDGVCRCTLDGVVVQANPAVYRLHGFISDAELYEHAHDMARKWYVDPNRRAEVDRMLAEHGRVDGLVSEVRRYKTGERRWVEESIRVVPDRITGQPRFIEGTVRDVTDAVQRAELQARSEKIASLVSGCFYQQRIFPDGSYEFPYISIGVSTLLGLTPDEVRNDPARMFACVHPDDRPALVASVARAVETMSMRDFDYRLVSVDGTERWVHGKSVPEREADGSVLWHGFIADITARKRAEARVYDLAYRDTLTGLPNRGALVDRLQVTINAPGQSVHWNALLFIDLDQFKMLNDTKGHHIGDRLLVEVAERLRPLINDRGMVARLGGDEFVVLLPDLAIDRDVAEQQVTRLLEKLHAAVADPFVLDGFPFHTSASIGVTLFRGREVGVDELLKRADMAMYEAKALGRGSASFFASEMQAVLEERLALSNELRNALEEGQLVLHYQPEVDDSGVPFGVEALLRWQHPTRGQVPPAVFIPLAERAGFTERIDAYVLATACNTLKRWSHDPALNHLQMAVNIGGRRIGPDLVDLVTAALESSGADPSHLTIEITEHVMLDNATEVDRALVALKALGVKIFLDDFGTGYSSLSHLKRLPIDALKIDYSFVRDIETDQNDRVIVQTILNIARNLGMAAIAEGVETEMQALLLRRFGCRAFQGYLYGRPTSLEEAERRCARRDAARAVLPPSRLVV
ncbi:MAG TPA: EAL domain-containing protein [Bauldia sp.]|nr:EAL domain-containing protein [Bauldia sp.]